MTYAYEIRHAGRVCCAGPDPDFPKCSRCKGKKPQHSITARPQLRRQALPLAPDVAARLLMRARAEIDAAKRAVEPQHDDPPLAHRALAPDDADDYTPPDPYERELVIVREQMSTPQSRWEEKYKADWLAELEHERNNPLPAPPERPPSREDYTPPNPYAALNKESK
jgi:hypothetical protein